MRNFLKTATMIGAILGGLYLYNTQTTAETRGGLFHQPFSVESPTLDSLGTCDSEWTKNQLRQIVTRDGLGNNTIIYDVTDIGGGQADDGTLHCFGRAFTSAGQKLILFQVMWTDPEHKRWYIEAMLLPL